MKRICFSVFSLLAIASLGGQPLTDKFHQKHFAKEQEIVIYNCADYIDETLIEEFEKEYHCKVNYYTYDTNETMYNQFTLQPVGTYDLICTSDYMIQRMIREGLVEPVNIAEECPVYNQYTDPNSGVREKLASMQVDTDGDGIKDASLDEYAVGYMWGTLGIIYDPTYKDATEDVHSWNIFWDEKYENVISIKNSMRDTFVVGLMHAYNTLEERMQKDELSDAEQAFIEAVRRAEVDGSLSATVQNIFDMVLTETDYAPILEIVKEELISLKKNIFGFEVDSGKNDIITGKIKMNLAWSGDAVYSIDEATTSGKILEYYVPDEGSNVWYDGWTIPKGANRELACAFMDFISDPERAARNMDYIGYTSFISGPDVFDFVAYKYGVVDYHEDAFYYGPYEDEETGEMVDGSVVAYDGKYYRCLQESEEGYPLPGTDSTFWEEIEAPELGNDYDLSYIFEPFFETPRSAIIHPYLEAENQLYTQYPNEETLERCAVMNDFEKANDDVIIMWGQLRAYTNMVPYYVILGTAVVVLFVFVLYRFIKKEKSSRNKRRLSKMKA